MTFIPNTVSEEKLIREMDASELIAYASELKRVIEIGDIPTGTHELLALVRIQYKQITGSMLSLETLERL